MGECGLGWGLRLGGAVGATEVGRVSGWAEERVEAFVREMGDCGGDGWDRDA